MKKAVFVIIGLLFFVGLALFPGQKAYADAGGTCGCVVGTSRTCGLLTNNCASGYQPSCTTTITQCNTTASSCTCVPSTTINCAPVGLHCSNTTPCCSPYICESTTKLCTGQSPNITPYEPFPSTTTKIKSLCESVQTADQGDCKTCMGDNKHIWTAIGCVSTDPNKLVNTILPFGIGIAGGIAFLLILFGALQMMTSAGNPEKLNAGKELISAAITGLLLIIFSVFILQLIGFQILHIPGFG